MSGPQIGAVDIGASKVLVGVAETSGRLIAERLVRFETPDDAEDLVEQVMRALAALGAAAPSIVSVAAPAPLDTVHAVMLNLHNRMWVNVPFGRMLGPHIQAPVVLEDDATAAAVAEARVGAGAGCDPVVYLTVSSGVGAGVVSGGQSLRGAHGLAGEIGHLVIDEDGPLCGCGRRGDVESYAGGCSLAHAASKTWEEPFLPDGTAAPRSAEDIFALALRGDARATDLIHQAGRALATAIAALACVVDPQRVVVGGSIALTQPDWLSRVARHARQLCMKETGTAMEVVPAGLGGLSALAGAALLGADQL